MGSGTSASSSIGVAVARSRAAQGVSREQLAAAAGLSPRTIYAIEVEGVQPHRATTRVLAEALGCDEVAISPTPRPHRGLQGQDEPRAARHSRGR